MAWSNDLSQWNRWAPLEADRLQQTGAVFRRRDDMRRGDRARMGVDGPKARVDPSSKTAIEHANVRTMAIPLSC